MAIVAKVSHIAIDARIINSTTGRYVERLLTHLQNIDHTNKYSVIVRAKDQAYWTPTSPNFTVRVADFDNYSFAEQLGFRRYLKKLQPDLVHFCMPQQPIWYKGQKVTTFHDLSLIKTYNSDKNWFIFHAKQLVGKFVFKKVARDNDHLIAISQYTKKELLQFTSIPEKKVTVIYESSDVADGPTKAYSLP